MVQINNLIIGISSGLASGKSSVAKHLEKKKFKIIKTNKILEEILIERKFSHSKREDFRKMFLREGSEKLVGIIINRIYSSKNSGCNYVINSIRHKTQNAMLKERCSNYHLIFLDTPPTKRYEFNKMRGRFEEDTLMSLRDFSEYIKSNGEEEISSLKNSADFILEYYEDIKDRLNSLDQYIKTLISF